MNYLLSYVMIIRTDKIPSDEVKEKKTRLSIHRFGQSGQPSAAGKREAEAVKFSD